MRAAWERRSRIRRDELEAAAGALVFYWNFSPSTPVVHAFQNGIFSDPFGSDTLFDCEADQDPTKYLSS